MAKKAVVKKEKYAGHKGPMPGLEIKTPYPEKIKKSDVDFIGDELAKLSERVNEVELSVSDLTNKLKVVMGRMGL
tara:strand:- start:253 stop:477 length:225 start_codon:yes stop_codon:yes gene_type:complete